MRAHAAKPVGTTEPTSIAKGCRRSPIQPAALTSSLGVSVRQLTCPTLAPASRPQFALFGAFLEEPFAVEAPVAEREVALVVPRPLIFGPVPRELKPVPVGVAEIESLMGSVVVVPV